jgi:hypothetical protein
MGRKLNIFIINANAKVKKVCYFAKKFIVF